MKKLLLVVLLLALFAIPVFGDVIVVETVGELESAVSDPEDGDVIIIKEGTYEIDPINTTKAISLIGEGKVYLNIKGSSYLILIHPENEGKGHKLEDDELLYDVTIKNLTIIPTTTTSTYGLKLSGIKNLEVKNVDVTANQTALDIHGCDGVVVKNVVAHDVVAGVGIAFTDTNNVEVKNVETYGNGWTTWKVGIAVWIGKTEYGYEHGFGNYSFKNVYMSEIGEIPVTNEFTMEVGGLFIECNLAELPNFKFDKKLKIYSDYRSESLGIYYN